jgi:hypothetical protein
LETLAGIFALSVSFIPPPGRFPRRAHTSTQSREAPKNYQKLVNSRIVVFGIFFATLRLCVGTFGHQPGDRLAAEIQGIGRMEVGVRAIA